MDPQHTINTRKALALAIVKSRREVEATVKVLAIICLRPGSPCRPANSALSVAAQMQSARSFSPRRPLCLTI